MGDYSPDDLRLHVQQSQRPMSHLARQLGTPLLLGVSTVVLADGGERSYNSAAMLGRDGALLGRYDKMHRVLFGVQVVPFGL